MLVLSRKQNESVVIDQEIRVVVLQVAQGSVRLGIERARTRRRPSPRGLSADL